MVILCAESNMCRAESTMRSKRDTWAFFAARWAARSRDTFCSGVSPGNEGGGGLAPPGAPLLLPGA